MLFSYNWLKKYVKGLPDPQKTADLLIKHSFEVEEIKKNGNDWVLDVKVLSNRADCFSHLGIAGELAVALGKKLPAFVPLKAGLRRGKGGKFKVVVEEKNLCRRYTAILLENVKVGESPIKIKERLQFCGINSINSAVDAVNYVMLETGQPLHVFDFDKVSDVNFKVQSSKFKVLKKIIVRRAKANEKITTLDDKEYKLNESILVIADEEEPLAIAGIKGGKKAEVGSGSKNILIESANFDRLAIRKGSRSLGLRTDASLRFEHGLDPNLTMEAIGKAVNLIQDLAGGKVTGGIDFYPKPVNPWRIKLDIEKVGKILGVEITEERIIKILENLNLAVVKKNKDSVLFKVPTFRQDLKIQEDLAEEAGRFYGFEKISIQAPMVYLKPEERNENIFWEDRAKDILKEIGFSEVFNYSFISEDEKDLFGFNSADLTEIENPLSSEQKYLRPILEVSLLKNIKTNQNNFDEINIFELGKVFRKIKTKNEKCKITEERILTAMMTGERFCEMKGVVNLLLKKLGIAGASYEEFENGARINVNQSAVGCLGGILPRILKALKISRPLTIFTLDFEALQKLSSEENNYCPISRFPSAMRDLAVLVPVKTKIAEVIAKMKQFGGVVTKEIDLFDIFEGDNISQGKKNLAFHIIYQSGDRTLSPEEIDEIHAKIVKGLEVEAGWEVRK